MTATGAVSILEGLTERSQHQEETQLTASPCRNTELLKETPEVAGTPKARLAPRRSQTIALKIFTLITLKLARLKHRISKADERSSGRGADAFETAYFPRLDA